ncbi:MAG TPA: hypothetical protein PKE31_03420 [Pseudomonadota bacterium]|nr:hypothetical protein [Pseudomonadota bacterium]
MKYTSFRNLIVFFAVSGLFGSLYHCAKNAPTTVEKKGNIEDPVNVSPRVEEVGSAGSRGSVATAQDTPKPVTTKQDTGTQEVNKTARPTFPLRPFDDEIVQLFQQKATWDKVKDATPNRPYKVNLYAEGGKVVRAKVDLNRNGKWDEKWSVDEKNGETVYKRQVSPTDDDTNYPEKYKLRNKQNQKLWEQAEP